MTKLASPLTGPALYQRAKNRIPGGTQLLSKRPEMFLPDQWPAYFSRAKGVEVVDLDGRRFIDMSQMAIGACVLGYGDPDVDDAVKNAVEAGVACTLNAPEEVQLADLLCEIHPWAEMVRYARSGGESMSVATRIARAHTRKDRIAFCGYHGWTDWYLAANLGEQNSLDGHLLPGLQPAGVPRGLKGTAIPFHYNRLDQLEAIVAEHGDDLAAIVMEPQRDTPPEAGFLEGVRAIASRIGAVLVFDEITSAFRQNSGGIHLLLGVEPDIAVFAKALGNGYAMAAIIGRRGVMEAAQGSFISSTNWTERIGPAAALAMIRKHRAHQVGSHLNKVGTLMLEGWEALGKKWGLQVHVSGLPSMPHFAIVHEDELALMTLFTKAMLDEGYLATGALKMSFAHTEEIVERYFEAADRAFGILAKAAAEGNAAQLVGGPLARRGFYRLT